MILFVGILILSNPSPYNMEPLPKNHPLVKALKKYVADGRKSELRRKLEEIAGSSLPSDSRLHARIALEDLDEGDYRSPFLERALKDIGVGNSFYYNLIGEKNEKSWKRRRAHTRFCEKSFII